MTEPGESKASFEERLSSTISDLETRRQAYLEWWEQEGAHFVSLLVAEKIPPQWREDVCQDSCIALLKAVEDGKYERQPKTSFRAYARTITNGKIAGFWKKFGRHLLWTPLEEVPQHFLQDDPQNRPSSEIENQEILAALEAGLEQLPACWREVVEQLRDGQKNREIAQNLGITQNAVSQYRRRAIFRLREIMRDFQEF